MLPQWLIQVLSTLAPQSMHSAMPPLTPSSRALNIRSVHTVGSAHFQRSRASPACLASGTVAGFFSFVVSVTNPPSCAPFAPPQLRGFLATMGALTPVRPALRPIHAFALYRMNSGTYTNRSPRFTRLAFLTIPSPIIRRVLPPLFHATPQLDRFPLFAV